jgi:hypothetical protein
MRITSVLMGGLLLMGAAPVSASCLIKNETGTSFLVDSGNTANQPVNAHAATTIAPGQVLGHSADGKEIAGVCKDGGNLVIRDRNGVPLLGPASKKRRASGRTPRPAR